MSYVDGALAAKRPGAGDHFVEQDTGGKNIRAFIDAIAARLFGRRVRGRAIRHANLSKFGPVNSRSAGFFIIQQFRETEVEHFHLACRRDHHIA